MLDPVPAYLNCPDCGTSLAADAAGHTCDDRQRRDHEERVVTATVDELESDFRAYLSTPRGRFEAFYAQRSRR